MVSQRFKSALSIWCHSVSFTLFVLYLKTLSITKANVSRFSSTEEPQKYFFYILRNLWKRLQAKMEGLSPQRTESTPVLPLAEEKLDEYYET